MKQFILFCLLSLGIFAIGSVFSCKKDNMYFPPPPPPPPDTAITTPITTSFTEEFEDFSAMISKGWFKSEYSQVDSMALASWTPGPYGPTKPDTNFYGFYAYSYQSSSTEYLYSGLPAAISKTSVSSWLFTPVLVVKNGDSISFYTRGDTTGIYTDRMQVLMDTLGSVNVGNEVTSVGKYTTTLFDINPNQAAAGYPTIWKKYEYTFSGLTGSKNIRIGFRHFVFQPINARGVGLDQFKFGVQ
jgi:hypothetical protein